MGDEKARPTCRRGDKNICQAPLKLRVIGTPPGAGRKGHRSWAASKLCPITTAVSVNAFICFRHRRGRCWYIVRVSDWRVVFQACRSWGGNSVKHLRHQQVDFVQVFCREHVEFFGQLVNTIQRVIQ